MTIVRTLAFSIGSVGMLFHCRDLPVWDYAAFAIGMVLLMVEDITRPAPPKANP